MAFDDLSNARTVPDAHKTRIEDQDLTPATYGSVLTPQQAAAFNTLMLIQGHNGDTVGRGRVVDYHSPGAQAGNPAGGGDPYAGIGPHTIPVYDKDGKLLGYTRPTGIYPKSMFDEHGALKRPGTPGSENPLANPRPGHDGIAYENLHPGAMWEAPYGYSPSGQPADGSGINPQTVAGISNFAPGQKYGPFVNNPGIDPMETGQASETGYSGHAMDPHPSGPPTPAPTRNGPARAEL